MSSFFSSLDNGRIKGNISSAEYEKVVMQKYNLLKIWTVPALAYAHLCGEEEAAVFFQEVLYKKPKLAVSFLEDTVTKTDEQ